MLTAALGLRAHSGWAVLVALGGPPDAPLVLLRRRLELCDRAVAGSAQPYHAAANMSLPKAHGFLERCAATALSMATAQVADAAAELEARKYRAAGCCVLLASGKPLPELARVLASHTLIHTAEGELYRDALRRACAACGVTVTTVRERDLVIDRRTVALGERIGPPWRQDEKLCAAAGWRVLASAG